jgi:hypothetical protein
VDNDACESSIREFFTKLKEMHSCYNKTERHFIKCDCISKLQGLDQAVAYLAAFSQMKKREHDALYNELINDQRQSSEGYNLRIDNDGANGY